MDERLFQHLSQYDISYTEYKHDAVFNMKESGELNIPFKGIVPKNLFLRDKKKNYYLVAMAGNVRLDLKSLAKTISSKNLSFASPEDLQEILNVTPGSVSIFSIVHSNIVTLVLDSTLWNSEFVCFHPNRNTSTLELDHQNFEKLWESIPNTKMIVDIS